MAPKRQIELIAEAVVQAARLPREIARLVAQYAPLAREEILLLVMAEMPDGINVDRLVTAASWPPSECWLHIHIQGRPQRGERFCVTESCQIGRIMGGMTMETLWRVIDRNGITHALRNYGYTMSPTFEDTIRAIAADF